MPNPVIEIGRWAGVILLWLASTGNGAAQAPVPVNPDVPAGSEIAAVWGLAFALFLEWEGERLLLDEIRLGVIVTMLGVFATRMVAIVRGTKGWRFA